MKVYIANFGRENYAWPECLARNTIATMNDVAVQGFWEAGDRESYIQNRMRLHKTAAGLSPTRSVASRWFNLMTTIAESSGDIWIHREKEQLWWTTSLQDAALFGRQKEPVGDHRDVIICHKSCEPWSNKVRQGNRLEWNGLHPKAKEFLFTEGTLQKLNDDNSEYALKLIESGDLSPWHNRAKWKEKLQAARATPGVVFSARQRAIARMAMAALQIAKFSNGQEVTRTVKDKEVRFSQLELERYLTELIKMQDGLCALTGIPLQYDGEHDDQELLSSLDRIDSDGHYEDGNLQVVCRFANRWKNNAKDADFRRLIEVVRSQS